MEHIERIQRTIDFIEEDLGRQVTLDALADMACYSKYHYHRIFLALAGEPVMEYVRKRRLAEAARRIAGGGEKIIDIAFGLGFNSYETFIRAFRREFSVTPGRYRKSGGAGAKKRIGGEAAKLTLLKLNIISGGRSMKPKIKTREAFYVIGMECVTTVAKNKSEKVIPALWDKFMPRMKEIGTGLTKYDAYGVCFCQEAKDGCCTEGAGCSDPASKEFRYMAGVEAAADASAPKGMVKKLIPAAKYAVFTHSGPVSKIYETLDRIYGEWAMQPGVELDRTACDFELYDARFTNDEHSELDIYVPIK